MKKIAVLILFVFLLGCAKTITEDEAVASAQNFVNGHVVLYAKDMEEKVSVNKAEALVKSIELKGNVWNVAIEVSSQVKDDEKSAALLVGVDAVSGEVVSFNNQKVGLS